MGQAIYSLELPRQLHAVKKAVNASAVRNVQWAIEHVFPGWTKKHHSVALALPHEVIPAQVLRDMIGKDSEAAEILKSFIRYGLLGTAERLPQRHSRYYRQRFSFGDAAGQADGGSLTKDYFFVHPAFREWIEHGPESAGRRMGRNGIGVAGDGVGYESEPPLIRLEMKDGQIRPWLRTRRRLAPVMRDPERSRALRFLVLVLCACRERMQNRASFTELAATLEKLKKDPSTQGAIRLSLPRTPQEAVSEFRDLQKRINQDDDIRELQANFHGSASRGKRGVSRAPRTGAISFLGVNDRSKLEAELEVYFHWLSIGDIDWDDQLAAVLKDRESARRSRRLDAIRFT